MNKLPNIYYTSSITSLIDGLKAEKCELCGNRTSRNAPYKKNEGCQREATLGIGNDGKKKKDFGDMP